MISENKSSVFEMVFQEVAILDANSLAEKGLIGTDSSINRPQDWHIALSSDSYPQWGQMVVQLVWSGMAVLRCAGCGMISTGSCASEYVYS